MSNDDHLTQEAVVLLRNLRDRGLRPSEACAVMGIAICHLIPNLSEARLFIRALAQTMDQTMENRE